MERHRKRTLMAIGLLIAHLAIHGQAEAQSESDAAESPASVQPAAPAASASYVAAENAETSKDSATRQRKWNFTIAPYVLIPFLRGSVTLAGQRVDIDFNTGEIMKRLKGFAFLYFEARHPKFAVATDLFYVNLGQGGQLPITGRSADFKMQQLFAEFVFLGKIIEWFELGFGGRVNFLQTSLEAPAGMSLPAVDLEFRRTWFVPLMALRFLVPFKNDHWRLALRADVGGFKGGSAYSWQWQVYPYGGYNFDGIHDKRVFELGLAFRAIGMKYETGSGLRSLAYAPIIWGPEIGFLFHF